ncbi:MAG: helix-turn-helix transcriptional regulator, partial [Acidothermales bacterium]|nr:helix-turn-helix transcriptional regulator [Acidothermales bacterium]
MADVRDDERIGVQVSAVRRLRHMTQRELARRANVSYSLVTKVESGHAPASPVFVAAVARALRVDPQRLTGQPFREVGSATADANVLRVRRSLLTHDLPTELDAAPRRLSELGDDVERTGELRRACRFTRLAAMLPGLLDELTYVVAAHPTSEGYALLAEAFYAAECLGSGLGYDDVYVLGVERVSWAAEHAADPLWIGAARWGRAGTLMRDGGHAHGLRLLEATRDDITDHDHVDALALVGSLHLRSALLASRSARADDTWAHLAEAREIAARVGDGNAYELAFGPSNTTVTGVAVAVELADDVRALELADTADALSVPAERYGHHFLDLARAHLMHGNRDTALTMLQRGRRVAPEQLRYHPQAR